MAEQKRRKGGGGKLSRTETVTVRLDPKLRYLTELAARKHNRTLSSYIEWTLKTALESEQVRPVDTPAHAAAPETIGTEAEYLWDVDEADRFAKLALRYPHLLTYDEQVRWKLIKENGLLWSGRYRNGPTREWVWSVDESSLVYERLREHWETFCTVADAGRDRDKLPDWQRTDPGSPPARSPSPFDDIDDEIPF